MGLSNERNLEEIDDLAKIELSNALIFAPKQLSLRMKYYSKRKDFESAMNFERKRRDSLQLIKIKIIRERERKREGEKVINGSGFCYEFLGFNFKFQI